MENAGILPSRYGLQEHGIRNIRSAYWNLRTAQLVEHAVGRHVLHDAGARGLAGQRLEVDGQLQAPPVDSHPLPLEVGAKDRDKRA